MLLTLIAFAILLVISWPVALIVLVLWPIIWLITLPFRLLGLFIGAVLALLAITIPLVSSKPLLVTILAAALTAWIGQVCLAFAFGAGGRRFGHCVWNVGAVGPTLVVRLTSFPDSGETGGFTLQKGVKP